MFLPEYNSTQLQRNPSSVLNAATIEPVVINRQGKEGVVIMSKKEYAKLVKAAAK
tara:strand:- start:10611 stop:10775 length:165 start_codon:yes stop_codon:yes gene_type:complete